MSVKYGSKQLEKEYDSLILADLLLMEREGLELTQVDMAKKLKVSKQRLCDFEKGRRLPSPKMVASWAKKLKQPPEIWIQLLLQDQLRRDNLNFELSVAS